MNAYSISPATVADIPALDKLVNSAYRGDSSKQGWTTEADLLDGLRTDAHSLANMLANPLATILKLDQDGELKACVYLEQQSTSLYLGMLTVDPTGQAQGIGRLLLQAAEDLARQKKCQAIFMTVITIRHELIAWYERRGFERTGEKKPFPNDPSFGLPKQPLEFEVLKKIL